jgi:hypothetical protein
MCLWIKRNFECSHPAELEDEIQTKCELIKSGMTCFLADKEFVAGSKSVKGRCTPGCPGTQIIKVN